MSLYVESTSYRHDQRFAASINQCVNSSLSFQRPFFIVALGFFIGMVFLAFFELGFFLFVLFELNLFFAIFDIGFVSLAIVSFSLPPSFIHTFDPSVSTSFQWVFIWCRPSMSNRTTCPPSSSASTFIVGRTSIYSAFGGVGVFHQFPFTAFVPSFKLIARITFVRFFLVLTILIAIASGITTSLSFS